MLLAVLFLWVSPAVTASPYGKKFLASSGAAVICGGTPLVENLPELYILQLAQLTFKAYWLVYSNNNFCLSLLVPFYVFFLYRFPFIKIKLIP